MGGIYYKITPKVQSMKIKQKRNFLFTSKGLKFLKKI